MTRSQIIREVETDLAAARARGMMKQPQHPGLTEREYHQRFHWKLWHVAAILLAVAAVGVKGCLA